MNQVLKVKTMSRVRIKDNSRVLSAGLDSVPQLREILLDKDICSLRDNGIFVFPETLGDSEDLSAENYILRSISSKEYMSGNIMGLLGIGGERLIISSRFSNDNDDFFFRYMLGRVFDIPNLLDLSVDGEGNERLFDLLAFIFPRYLTAAVRKGVYKTYKSVRYNDSNYRGNLDVSRHLRSNVPFVGRIAYTQREFTVDNHVTQLIRHVIELIGCDNRKAFILATARNAVDQIVEATPSYSVSRRAGVLHDNLKSPVRHAYFHEYAQLQIICMLILRHAQQGFDSSPNKLHGIIFDGAWLWEEYLNKLVSEFFHHPQNKSGLGKEYLFTSSQTGRKNGLILPDFISKSGMNNVIADAKYKPQGNIRNSDYLQILAYMFRFGAKNGIFFYPEGAERNEEHVQKYFLNKGISAERTTQISDDVFIEKIGFKVPQNAVSFEEFSQKILLSEDRFRSMVQHRLSPSDNEIKI